MGDIMTDVASHSDLTPFADLPAALVEEVLGKTSEIVDDFLRPLKEISNDRDELRKRLYEKVQVIRESSLGSPQIPTTCASDGSYAIERLLTTDLAAAAAVAVEGLTPPSEKRHWNLPHHRTFICAEPHSEDTATVLRAVMLGEELRLATEAPLDLVMIDGTLTLPIIYFNQALNAAPQKKESPSSTRFVQDCLDYLQAYLTLLGAKRSDKQYVGLPKYSTRREIGNFLQWPTKYDDRGMLTLLLEPGELTDPLPIEHPRDNQGNPTWHLDTARLPDDIRERAKELADQIVSAIEGVHVFYYKPYEWLPALRVELPSAVAKNQYRLATVVHGLKHQTATPSILEPYPIYLADRMVKALARAMPAFRQVTTQRISERYNGNIGEVFFAMHSYRSESGV